MTWPNIFLDQNNPKIVINEPLAQFAVSFISVFHELFEDSEWSLRTRAWKQRKKSSCVIPKVVTVAYNGTVAIAYESFSLLTKLKSQFKRGFTKAVVKLEWSQGKLWLYYNKTWTKFMHSKRALYLIFCHLHVHFITCWPTYIQNISRQPSILNIVNWSVRKTRSCSSVIFRVNQEIAFFRSYT